MNVFVTVGTTKFDSLIDAVVSDKLLEESTLVLQVGPGGCEKEGFRCFEFTKDIDQWYEWADVIVTHAGAGSVYRLLEMGRKIVIVPNLERIDHHQSDIATYMHAGGFALCERDVGKVGAAVVKARLCEFVRFDKEPFFAASEIVRFLS